MSCYAFTEEDRQSLRNGERLFVPGIYWEDYDCWEINYTRDASLTADDAMVFRAPITQAIKIPAIENETEDEAVNRFKKWCHRAFSMIYYLTPGLTINDIQYVKREDTKIE